MTRQQWRLVAAYFLILGALIFTAIHAMIRSEVWLMLVTAIGLLATAGAARLSQLQQRTEDLLRHRIRNYADRLDLAATDRHRRNGRNGSNTW